MMEGIMNYNHLTEKPMERPITTMRTRFSKIRIKMKTKDIHPETVKMTMKRL